MAIIPESITPLGLSTTETAGSGQYIVTGLSFEVLGERVEFWGDDDIGLFYAYIPIPASPAVSTVIKVLDGANNLVDQLLVPYVETTNRFSFQIDIASLSDGDFSVEVYTQSNIVIGEGGFTVGGDAAYGISRYDHFPDGIGLVTNGSADVTSTGAASFAYAAEGGVETGGEAEYANSYHVFAADGGLATDNNGNDAGAGILGYFHIPSDEGIVTAGTGIAFNGAPFYEASGGMSLSSGGRYNIGEQVQPELNRLECIDDQSFWCEENEDCILKEEKVIYNGGLIPAYTVCNSNREVKRATRANVERNV